MLHYFFWPYSGGMLRHHERCRLEWPESSQTQRGVFGLKWREVAFSFAEVIKTTCLLFYPTELSVDPLLLCSRASLRSCCMDMVQEIKARSSTSTCGINAGWFIEREVWPWMWQSRDEPKTDLVEVVSCNTKRFIGAVTSLGCFELSIEFHVEIARGKQT